MNNIVSILIPARNEVYLQKTIDNIIENAEEEIEIIAVLDGYLPDPPLKEHPFVKLIHHAEAQGQRQSINAAARLAKGKYVMKLDAHCAVDKGFDVKLKADCEYDWTVIPAMRNLDVKTWKPKEIDDVNRALSRRKLNPYMYIGWNDKGELRTLYYSDRQNRQLWERAEQIDDTMSCMGCCFFMHKDRFWELGGCDETHGGWGQQGVEVACKAWLSGGSLKVNKKTWFAHWFRAGDGGFPYHISGKEVSQARHYSKEIWLNNKWEKQVRPFSWLIEKFNPPTWDKEMSKFDNLYKWVFDKLKRNYPKWRGHKIIKFPTDLILYEQVIWEKKPDLIIECGTAYGGSAVFFADMLELIGKGKVLTIDIGAVATPEHPRVEYYTGRTTAVDTLEYVRKQAEGKSVMVILDSDHRRIHVKRELHFYSQIVTTGQYMVVEDAYYDEKKKPPVEAIDWFLKTKKGKAFKRIPVENQFKAAITRGGWLIRQQ